MVSKIGLHALETAGLQDVKRASVHILIRYLQMALHLEDAADRPLVAGITRLVPQKVRTPFESVAVGALCHDKVLMRLHCIYTYVYLTISCI